MHQDETGRRFDVPLADITSRLIRKFHDHWGQLRPGRLPSRADIDPVDFKWVLPNIILSDVERNPLRIRYRLCGARIVEFCGNLAGQYLDELSGAELWLTEVYVRQYRIVAEERRPVFSFDTMAGEDDRPRLFQTGIWPLAADGVTPDMCIAVEDYLDLTREEVRPLPDVRPR